MSANVKKAIWIIVAIFLISMVATDPRGSSAFVLAIWDIIWEALTNIGIFFEELFTGTLGR